jgi:molybdate transport system substrate-binding protein
MQVLAYYKLEAVLKPKLIYGEHVPQLCDYAARGEVDAALVFYSDYLARKDRLVLLETAPPFSHGEISYPIAVIRTAANPVEARRFMEMVLSGRGRVIMMKYGFKPSEKEVAWKTL